MSNCDSCESTYINGVFCHETGCPDAWKSYKKECKWCGCNFNPKDKYDDFCSDSCLNAWYGGPEEVE